MDNIIHTTVENCVRKHAIEMPTKTAVVCNGISISYSQLWKSVSMAAEQLSAIGLKDGALNIFRASQNADFIITYLATHLTGAVAVPLERDCPEKKFKDILSNYSGVVIPVNKNREVNIADILFTTGSTGQQKGVMESYRAIMANADNLIHAQGFTKDTVFIICGPLNHIGSLSKIWPVLILGGTIIIADGMKDMNILLGLFGYPSSSLATFMVPASIRMLLQFGSSRLEKLRGKIDFIETGGAAISQSDMEALCRILPQTRLYNTYASTETGIIATYDYNHNPCIAGCTGKAMRNSSVYITQEGKIACKGATLMSGYINAYVSLKPQTSNLNQQLSEFITCDIGEIDSNGCLHIKGRDNDVINVGGYKVSPQEVEDIANSYPAIAESLCLSFHSEIFGNTIKLIYATKNKCAVNKKELAIFMAARLERYKIPRVFEEVSSIQHTYNGKLDRAFYKQR